MPQFTLYGHKYLGPGNPINNGEPINSADRIAQQHDLEYAKAKTKQDIFNSDKKAIASFYKDFVREPSIGSAAGALGLSIKHSAETILGSVIYPSNISGKHNVQKKSKSWLHYQCYETA